MNTGAWHFYWWSIGAAIGFVACVAALSRWNALSWRALAVLLVAGALTQIGAKWQFRLQVLPVWEAVSASLRDYYEPGMRMPLGIAMGGVGGLLLAAILRVPIGALADALALGGSVMMVVGRLGCFAAGCCMGSPCPTWMHTVCPTFPAGSESYNQQLRSRAIELGAASSLPVHPLPVYFSISALLVLGLMVWRLHRGALAGEAALWFLALGSLSKLGLEYMRGSAPHGPTSLMFWLPAVGAAIGVAGIALLLRGRADPGRSVSAETGRWPAS